MPRPMLLPAAAAAALLLATPAAASIGTVAATVGYYEIQTPDIASCRLKGVDASSENFNLYASVSGKDVSMTEGCARCIKVSTDSGASVTAYVLDVCQGCKSGELKLSKNALAQIGLDQNVNGAKASYKFINCPTTFLSGNVKACLMEGASNSYIPLQFMNSQKVIKSVTINSIAATQNKDAFFYYASPQESKDKGSACTRTSRSRSRRPMTRPRRVRSRLAVPRVAPPPRSSSALRQPPTARETVRVAAQESREVAAARASFCLLCSEVSAR
ncbi:hypothetical protein PINS_up017415 [Pythium insidiosum]|nr:hypothetical protein PINS_up017415 [Pythium insidiosum]